MATKKELARDIAVNSFMTTLGMVNNGMNLGPEIGHYLADVPYNKDSDLSNIVINGGLSIATYAYNRKYNGKD